MSKAYMHGYERTKHSESQNLLSVMEVRALVLDLSQELSFSTGSACTSATVEPSHVLSALGNEEQWSHESIRIGVGRFNTEEEIQFTTDYLAKEAGRLQADSFQNAR
jgi:cysteine desulfurase